MGLADDLKSEIRKIFKSTWQTRQGRVVPSVADLPLDNQGIEFDATVLYADLADSTGLVRLGDARFAAEIYKAYLTSACRVIKANGGFVTAFDGDRVMAVFTSDSRQSAAARSALQLAWAVADIVNPALQELYSSKSYQVRQAVGVDTGKMLVAKTGVRGANDLVWTGLAANRAAKLCSVREDSFNTWVTAAVFSGLDDSARFASATERRLMWTKRTWNQDGTEIYGSNWKWPLS